MRFEHKVERLRKEKYGGRETKEFLAEVKKLADGERLEYLLGKTRFCGAWVDLSVRPMVPREETEHWVKQVIQEDTGLAVKQLRILDLFAGSGCVGMALLKHFENAYVTFVDIQDSTSVSVMKSLTLNEIEKERAVVLRMDVEEFLNSNQERYDRIFAVPPYVPPFMREEVMRELHAEHEVNFFDKEDGYYYHKLLLKHIPNLLTAGGRCYFEFDFTQYSTIVRLLNRHSYKYKVLLDQHNNPCAMCLWL